MKCWDLSVLSPSTEKETPRAPGRTAARVPRTEHQIPRVLFSSPECRALVVELDQGEVMGDHQVRERAVVHVVAGEVEVHASGETAKCGVGSLIVFDPGERHNVRAVSASMLLLILAPWPAVQHYVEGEVADAQRLPPNASASET